MSRSVTIEEARAHLSELVEEVASGTCEIVLYDQGCPVARLLPPVRTGRRIAGRDAGKFDLATEFFEVLPPDVLDSFNR